MMGGFGVLVITGIIAAVFAGIGALVAAVAHHPAQTAAWAGVIAGTALLIWGIFWFCVKSPAAQRERAAEPQPDRWWEGAEYAKAAAKQDDRKQGKTQALIPRPPDTPICLHDNAIRVESVLDKDQTVAWWCPDCEETLDPGFRSSELKPERWPAVRKQDTHGTMPRYAAVMRIGEQTFDLGRYHARVLAIRACQKRPEWHDTQWLEVSGKVVTACRQSDGTEVTFAVIDGK